MPAQLLDQLIRGNNENIEDYNMRVLRSIVQTLVELEQQAMSQRGVVMELQTKILTEQKQVTNSVRCLKLGFTAYAKTNDAKWATFEPMLLADAEDDKLWRMWRNQKKTQVADLLVKALLALSALGCMYWLTPRIEKIVKALWS